MATYLITQATGQQSQSIIAHLLEAGAKVHAVVRNPQKIPPVLEKPGVTVFKGESVNFEEIFEAAKGCKAAFLNTYPWPGLEAQQAKTIVAACEKAGVESIVASTTLATNDKALADDPVVAEAGLREYYQSKGQVEEAARGFRTYTILRPGVIHADYMLPGVYGNFPGLPARGEIDHACNDGVRVPYTSLNDIGRYAAAALRDPAKFAGQEIDMTSELLTFEEVRDMLVKITGRDVRVKKLTAAEIEEAKATVFGMRFHLLANAKDFTEYIARLKETEAKFGLPFTPIETSLQRDKARLLECLPDSCPTLA